MNLQFYFQNRNSPIRKTLGGLTIFVILVSSHLTVGIAQDNSDTSNHEYSWVAVNIAAGLFVALPGGSPQVADDARSIATCFSFFWYPSTETPIAIGSTVNYGRAQHDDLPEYIDIITLSFDARIFLPATVFSRNTVEEDLQTFRPYAIVGTGIHHVGVDSKNQYERHLKIGVNGGIGFEIWTHSRMGISLEPIRFFVGNGGTKFWTSLIGLSVAFQ